MINQKDNWKYGIELRDRNVFDFLAQKYEIPFPEDLRSFIEENNAAYPEMSLIDVNGSERIFEYVLSFNETEDDALSVFDVLDTVSIKTALPFASDPFGNLFFYSLVNGRILYYDQDDDKYENTGYTLESLIEGLH